MDVSVFKRYLPRRLVAADPFDLVTTVLVMTLVVVVLATFRDYAISNDEEVQQRYGELIIAFYASGFTDRALFHFQNLYLYGGLFDVVATLLGKVLPFDLYVIRHVLCGMIGVAGIGATCVTARLIGGARAGFLAAAMLTVCGPWFGGMFNHTKDIPFGAAMMGATYFLCRAARDLPRPRWRDIIGFGLLLGGALGIRVLGLLFVGYAGLAILLYMPRGTRRERTRFVVRSALMLLPAFVLTYTIMVAAWPWAALEPLNPFRGLIAFGEFHYKILTILSGKVYEMWNIPRSYVPIYLLIKLPLAMLLGAAIAALTVAMPATWRNAAQPRRQIETAFIAFIALFPLVCEVASRGPAFTGLRHFLFVVPAIAVLAGLGFDSILTTFAARRRVVERAAFGTIVALCLWSADTLIRLHPYEYLFYNPLVGGLEGATRRYDTDYWVNIMPEAVADLQSELDRERLKGGSHRFTVAVCGERLPFEKLVRNDPRLEWTEDWKEADFFIAPTHMDCDRALDGKTIVTIARMGAPIGVVKDRRSISRPGIASR